MTLQLVFHITLLADYHSSAGYGKGSLVDSALQRDADGVPVLRGTSIAGLLRSEINRLAATPPFQQSQSWQTRWQSFEDSIPDPNKRAEERLPEAADLVFGAPWSYKIWQISSARPVDLVAPQQPSQENHSLGSNVAARVRVHPAQRRAEPRKLFLREEGDRRIQFEFTASCNVFSETMLADAALLVAAARMVDGLGAGRRRGRGDCTIHLHAVQGWPRGGEPQQTEETLLAHFESYWLKNGSLIKPTSSRPQFEAAKPTASSCRKWLLLRTDEPLLISRRAAAGNQFEGLDFIPGVTLRGALARLVADRFDLSQQKSQVYQEFVQLFYRDALKIGPLYPAHFDNESSLLYPTIPAPQDIFITEQHPGRKQLKWEHHPILHITEAAKRDFRWEDKDGSSLKIDPPKGFWGVCPNAPLVTVKRDTEMHVTLSEETGRARDQELFGYVVIAAGQYFMTELLFRDEADWKNLQALTGLPNAMPTTDEQSVPADYKFHLRLGKANRRGYGKITGALFAVPPQQPVWWAANPITERVIKIDAPTTLTLISDTIVLDAWGRAQQSFADEWLGAELKLPAETRVEILTATGATGNCYPLSAARGQMIDSFNNHVGLPRFRDHALGAGSAVTFRLLPGPKLTLEQLQERLAAIEEEGIGLRTGEGFGRVVFNHPIYQDACAEVEPSAVKLPAVLAYGEAIRFADWAQTETIRDLQSYAEALRKALRAIKPAKRANFWAVVHELNGGAWVNWETAKQVLDNYGESVDLLGRTLPGRQKPNFFKEDGKAVLQLIRTRLEELDTLCAGDADRWPAGCRQLAAWLADMLQEMEDR
ncbi:MAG: hypothetical protein KJZ93_03705 [Caldilineaceae bacterium]|nr:hypothetical protein [Caldilineaceae bacterium]